ncbi:hypothetical protein ACC677_37660, partial [Rhizobium ruizarguesonis]
SGAAEITFPILSLLTPFAQRMSNSQYRRNDDFQSDRQQDLLSGSCEAALCHKSWIRKPGGQTNVQANGRSTAFPVPMP